MYANDSDLIDDLDPPGWYFILRQSEMLRTQPWIIDDDPRITPHEWGQRAMVAAGCEAEAREHHRKQTEKNRPKGRR